jgi:PAS domain S-box-containing protein
VLAATQVVQKEAWERLAARLENAHQGAALEVRCRAILSNVRQPRAIECGANHEFHIVHDQWTVDRDGQRPKVRDIAKDCPGFPSSPIRARCYNAFVVVPYQPHLEPHPEAPAARLEFETLISDMSALLIAAPPEQVESAIEATLGHVRTFFEADRCGLLRVSGDQTFVNVAYAAYAEGVPVVAGDINLSELFPWASQRLLVQRLPVIVYRMAELPPEAAVDRVSWEQISPMRSNLAVPICDGATVRKIVVLHWVDRECQFPDSYIPRLRLLGEMMLNALNRMHAFEALRTSEERLNRAAAAGGCGLWELDALSRQLWVTSETRRLYGLDPEEPATWDRFLRLLHPDDRDIVSKRVAAVMDGNGAFDQRYRIIRGDGAVRWMHVTASRGSPTRLVGASIDVTERVEDQRRTREAL